MQVPLHSLLVQQLLVALIPMAGLLYPLIKYAPSLYDWTMDRRVYKLYDEVQRLEEAIVAGGIKPDTVQDMLTQLQRLDRQAQSLAVPISYRPRLHSLRSHIARVRDSIQRSI
jgi:hypothetical protein